MSVYNEKIEWLEKSISSILEQSYKNFEFIIICDNPDIENEIREYLLQLEAENSKIKVYFNERNIGLASFKSCYRTNKR